MGQLSSNNQRGEGSQPPERDSFYIIIISIISISSMEVG